jgi:hypothetical protein
MKKIPGFCDFLESCALVAIGASTTQDEMDRFDLSLDGMRNQLGGSWAKAVELSEPDSSLDGGGEKKKSIDVSGECVSDTVV